MSATAESMSTEPVEPVRPGSPETNSLETGSVQIGGGGPGAASGAADPAQAHRSHGVLGSFVRRPGGIVPLVVLAVIALASLLARWIAPYDPTEQHVTSALLVPSFLPGGDPAFLLGTDELGRDMLSRLIYGARTAMLLSLTAATVSAMIGTAAGLLAGLYTRTVGPVVAWMIDSQLAFPFIVLALVVITVRGNSMISLLFVLSLFGWVQFARVIRVQTLQVRNTDYVLAARSAGSPAWLTVTRHILPNVVPPAVVLWTFQVAAVLLLEGALSFLGLGVQPPQADWGTMFADGRAYLLVNPWNALLPGLAILVTVLCANILGRTLRTVLNPRLR